MSSHLFQHTIFCHIEPFSNKCKRHKCCHLQVLSFAQMLSKCWKLQLWVAIHFWCKWQHLWTGWCNWQHLHLSPSFEKGSFVPTPLAHLGSCFCVCRRPVGKTFRKKSCVGGCTQVQHLSNVEIIKGKRRRPIGLNKCFSLYWYKIITKQIFTTNNATSY